MTEFFITLGLGVMLGYVVCLSAEVRPVLNACEAELPRSQECVLTAAPKPILEQKP